MQTLCCTFLTAQDTSARIDPETGNVILPFQKAQELANIALDRDRLLVQIKHLEQKLSRTEKAIDSLQAIHQQTIQQHNDYLIADRLRDQAIDQTASDQIDVWKGLSKGIGFSTQINSQVYSFTNTTPTIPLSIDARLSVTGTRFTFAAIPFAGLVNIPGQSTYGISGLKLSVGYKWF